MQSCAYGRALAIRVNRKLNSIDVVDALTDHFILGGTPAFIRSDIGPEFIAQKIRDWIGAVGAKTAYIRPGSPWAETVKQSIRGIDCRSKGYCESFNARFRDELLNGEIFYTLKEAQIIIEQWQKHYNRRRPHSDLDRRPPTPEAILPLEQRLSMH